ncbi:MAG: ferrous iron transport protein B [Chitinophagales bacterium]|nr:ferrous iron transport protein B [Chitinophagales bacterium]
MEEAATIREKRLYTVALLGNPNCGKSSIFNQLTGLRQKVGNFPGVTVDKKIGKLKLTDETEVKIIDFPGTYSFYPTSVDERIVVQTLSNPQSPDYPDAVVYIADVTKLEKHLLLFSQVNDLNIPLILGLNMADIAQQEGLEVDIKLLEKKLEVPIVMMSGRTGEGIDGLKEQIDLIFQEPAKTENRTPFYKLDASESAVAAVANQYYPEANLYQSLLVAHHHEWLSPLLDEQQAAISKAAENEQFVSLKSQVRETMDRYEQFIPIAQKAIKKSGKSENTLSERLDSILTHNIFGPLIFWALMLMVFQAIFSWASLPMDLIDGFFGWLGESVRSVLPGGWFTDLITDGIIAGLGGILIFIPQIAILFFLIALLEEVGYMDRAAYMFDRLMQRFGLNGRSIVALISSGACAIPAIMSTRTIGNWKERLITILVTPFISCSARIPVYAVLIGFVVPSKSVAGGLLNLQGLAFMGLYLLGILAALVAAWIFKLILKTQETSLLMLELPEYRSPVMRNVLLEVWEKVSTFVKEAGRIILGISIILWLLASYGPSAAMQQAEQTAIELAESQQLSEQETEDLVAAHKIEASFAGHLGKAIEPVIRPLGYDWKIGIALITSFAAREVFVGTMATIYSIGSSDDEFSIKSRMAQERHPDTGKPVYTLATSLSLLIFYVFAMQCMSTLAVVYRETKSWKWPLIQFLFMSGLAYLGALFTYQLLS